MNLLLDTHVLIWALADSPKLSKETRQLIVDGKNLIYVSVASVWEIAIKQALGKLKVPDNLLEELEIHRFTLLDIKAQHALATRELPGIHKDPFDRTLIAQTQVEKLKLLTADRRLADYSVALIMA